VLGLLVRKGDFALVEDLALVVVAVDEGLRGDDLGEGRTQAAQLGQVRHEAVERFGDVVGEHSVDRLHCLVVEVVQLRMVLLYVVEVVALVALERALIVI